MKITKPFIRSPLCLFFLLGSSTVYSLNLPSDEEVNGILKQCAGGRKLAVAGDIKGAISLWKRMAQAQGEAKIEDLGAIIEGFKDENLKLQAYTLYLSCIKDSLSRFASSTTTESKEHSKKGEGISAQDIHNLKGLRDALASGDPYERRIALASALASDSLDLKNIALSEIFASSQVLSINAVWRETRNLSAIIEIEDFDKSSGVMLGNLSGSDVKVYNPYPQKNQMGYALDDTTPYMLW